MAETATHLIENSKKKIWTEMQGWDISIYIITHHRDRPPPLCGYRGVPADATVTRESDRYRQLRSGSGDHVLRMDCLAR